MILAALRYELEPLGAALALIPGLPQVSVQGGFRHEVQVQAGFLYELEPPGEGLVLIPGLPHDSAQDGFRNEEWALDEFQGVKGLPGAPLVSVQVLPWLSNDFPGERTVQDVTPLVGPPAGFPNALGLPHEPSALLLY